MSLVRRAALAAVLAATLVLPLVAHADSLLPASERITGAYALSDHFWTWDSATLLHVDVSPADETLGYVRSTPYLIDCPNACTRPFAFGQSVQLTAYPSPGARFAGWSGAACAAQGNPCTLTMSGDTIVTADFAGRYVPPATRQDGALVSYTLTVVPQNLATLVDSSPAGIDGCADGSGTCTASFAAGTTVTLTDNAGCPAVGWVWGGDGTTEADHTRSVLMDGDKTVTARIAIC